MYVCSATLAGSHGKRVADGCGSLGALGHIQVGTFIMVRSQTNQTTSLGRESVQIIMV